MLLLLGPAPFFVILSAGLPAVTHCSPQSTQEAHVSRPGRLRAESLGKRSTSRDGTSGRLSAYRISRQDGRRDCLGRVNSRGMELAGPGKHVHVKVAAVRPAQTRRYLDVAAALAVSAGLLQIARHPEVPLTIG